MFGHLQSTASDSLARFEESITAAQFGKDREIFLSDLAKKMSEGVSLASIPELERLWFELLRELEASGSVENSTRLLLITTVTHLRKTLSESEHSMLSLKEVI